MKILPNIGYFVNLIIIIFTKITTKLLKIIINCLKNTTEGKTFGCIKVLYGIVHSADEPPDLL